jgi:hypothetical protein
MSLLLRPTAGTSPSQSLARLFADIDAFVSEFSDPSAGRITRSYSDNLAYEGPKIEIDESPTFTGLLGSVSSWQYRYANVDQVAAL